MVIAKRMEPLVAGSSIIRKLFEEGKEMAKKVGAENVYDYSLGNPSVPAPDAVKSSIIKILDTEDPLFVHGYMSNSGYEEVRQAVADNLNERFQWQYKMEDIIMTVGAASGINDILNLFLDSGDEVVVFAPFFGEYRNYVITAGGVLKAVPADTETFQINIDGLDAGRKVAILASVAFNSRVVFDDVYIEGITKISAKDIRYAKEMGCAIKLLGVARNTDTGVEAYVCPMLIPNDHPLATVNDSYNAVFVHGDAVEDAMFFGRGAGELPTASAVVGDIFDIVRNIVANCCGRIGCTCYKQLPVKRMEDTYNRYFLRLHVEDRCGVLAEMTEVFAKYHVSIAQIIQRDSQSQDDHLAEVVVITAKVREGDFKTAVQELSNKSSVKRISKTIRVYGK